MAGTIAGVGGGVGDDVDVQLGGVGQQLLGEVLLAPETALGGAAAHHDLGDAGDPGELRDLEGHVGAVDRFDLAAQLLGQTDVGPQALDILLRHGGKVRGFHEQGREGGLEGLGHTGGGADDAGVGGRRGEAHQDALLGVIVLVAAQAAVLTEAVHPVGAAAQGDLTEGGQIFNGEEVGHGPLGLGGAVDLAAFQALQELLGLNIHDLHLACPVKDGVGDALPDGDAGDGGHGVVEALDVLDIDGGIDVDAGLQQLLHVLVALGVAAAGGVGMGQLVHQDQLRVTAEGGVQIELPQGNISVAHRLGGQLLQPLGEGQGFRAGVGLDVAGHHLDALALGLMGGGQHGVGLAHTGGVAEKNLQKAPGIFLLLLGLDLPEQLLGVALFFLHGEVLPSLGFLMFLLCHKWDGLCVIFFQTGIKVS